MRFDRRSRKDLRELEKAVLLRAARARTNSCDFVEFVLKEQVSRRPIRVTPHQRVGLDFARDHSRCVRIWPAGASKTMISVGEILFKLGTDPTARGMVVSKAEGIAAKTVRVVRDYIDHSVELRLVFPNLRRGARWRDDSIEVDRPDGIPDASVAAVGIGGQIQGARLNFAIIDDILDFENTATEDGRKKVIDFVRSSVISRLDPAATVIVNNTAWHPHDLVHELKRIYASLRMTITGDVHVGDDPARTKAGLPPWDHPLLRAKYAAGDDYACRLVREGVDDERNDVPLFPERFMYVPWEMPDGTLLPPARDLEEAIPRARIDVENKRRELGPSEFARLHMGIARDDSSAFCKEEWIELCKRNARELKHFEMVSRYEGPNPVFTGLDLAIGLGEEHDSTAFFTFEVLPDRRRKILDVEVGKWPGPEIVRKLIAKQRAYNSVVRVENNGAQEYLRQQILNFDASLPIKPHTTGRTKAHPEYGVPGGFVEMSNGTWLIPNDAAGRCHPHVQAWIDGCLYYAPAKHTNDAVMAWYFAREQAKEWGLLNPPPRPQGGMPRAVAGGIFA